MSASDHKLLLFLLLLRITVICYKYKDGHGQMLKQLKEHDMIREQILSQIKKKEQTDFPITLLELFKDQVIRGTFFN